MPTLKTKPHFDIETIETLRDELALQAHLMKTEVKAEWSELDKKWQVAKREFDTLRSAAEKSRQEISTSATSLLKTFADGFAKIRKAVA